MKKIFAITFALVLTLALAAPAFAATVDTTGTVSGGAAPPGICAKFETPDEDSSSTSTVEVYPEPANPPHMQPAGDAADGWKRMNFYAIVGDPNGVQDIAAVDVTVKYPDGTEKFQLRAITDGAGGWTASGGPFPNPAPYNQPAPTWTVRQLKLVGSTWDRVDANADGDTADACDLTVPDFLASYGSRVTYGPNPTTGLPYTRSEVVYDVGSNKQIMLELVGYIWFKQDACDYTVEVEATDMSGATTPEPLCNQFTYHSIVNLWTDFDAVAFGSLIIGSNNVKYGDNDLTTPNRPTVWNNGNDPAMLSVSATKMLLDNEPSNATIEGKYIEDFDCTLDRKDPVTGEILEIGTVLFKAGDPPIIIRQGNPTPTECPVLLPACQPAQIDFSVHPKIGTKGGSYTGSFTLYISHYECDAD